MPKAFTMFRTTFLALALSCGAATVSAQTTTTVAAVPAVEKKIVEASCGKCKFGMAGDDCALAVRINNKAYYVDGSDIDQHGD
ncbi:MAG: hypothetical protein EOP50_15930, partial [Sphingobacteriales bacterium]